MKYSSPKFSKYNVEESREREKETRKQLINGGIINGGNVKKRD